MGSGALFRPPRLPATRKTAALVVALAAAVAVLAGPTAVAAAGDVRATAHRGAESAVAVVEPITLADLRQLVEEFEATGEVTSSGAARLGAVLSMAELYDERGLDFRTISALELFKDTAADPVRIPSEFAREALIATANQLIVQLGGTPG